MKNPFFARGLGLAVFFATSVVGVVLGQGGRQQLGNSEQIENAWKKVDYNFRSQLARGYKPPLAADLDLAARLYVYRMTWDESLTAKTVKEFNDLIDKEVNGPPLSGQKGDNTEFKKLWSKALVDRFRELTDLPLLDNARAILHGAQMFPGLAKMQQEVAAVYLQELIDDKSSRPGQDAIRLYALRALGEMLPVTPWGEPDRAFAFKEKVNIEKKERDLARIDILTRFILRPAPTPPNPDTLEAYRYVRREAIEALAKGGWPAVNSYRENGAKVEGPIALTLMKVLVPGNLNPPPTLAEKNEAALGLCAIKATSTYDSKPMLPYVAATLIELNKTYAEDLPNIKAGQAHFAWKIEGARWRKALDALVEPIAGPFSKDAAGKKLADKLAGGVTAYNSNTGNGDDMANTVVARWIKHLDPVNTLKIEDYIKSSPQSDEVILFKNIESPTLKRVQPAAE
jgi:hypothetical protein